MTIAEQVREACAQAVLNGRFLTEDAPIKKWAEEVAAMLRDIDLTQFEPKVGEDVRALLKRLRGAGETYTYLHEAADLIESLSAQLATVSKQFVDMKTYADQCDRKIADLTKANQVLEKLAKQSAVIQIDAIGKEG